MARSIEVDHGIVITRRIVIVDQAAPPRIVIVAILLDELQSRTIGTENRHLDG